MDAGDADGEVVGVALDDERVPALRVDRHVEDLRQLLAREKVVERDRLLGRAERVDLERCERRAHRPRAPGPRDGAHRSLRHGVNLLCLCGASGRVPL